MADSHFETAHLRYALRPVSATSSARGGGSYAISLGRETSDQVLEVWFEREPWSLRTELRHPAFLVFSATSDGESWHGVATRDNELVVLGGRGMPDLLTDLAVLLRLQRQPVLPVSATTQDSVLAGRQVARHLVSGPEISTALPHIAPRLTGDAYLLTDTATEVVLQVETHDCRAVLGLRGAAFDVPIPPNPVPAR